MKKLFCVLLALSALLSLAACGMMGDPDPGEGLTDEEYYETVVNGLKEAEVYAFNPQYISQRNGPDILTASVKNNSGKTISKIYLAFVAWDAEGNPIALLDQDQVKGDSGKYCDLVYTDPVFLLKDQIWNEGEGYGLSDDCEISSFRVIAQGYETGDGTTWENPHYSAWCDIFEGKTLKDYMNKDEVGVKPDPKVAYEEMVASVKAQPIYADSPVYLTQPLEDDLIIARFHNKTPVTIKKFYLAYTAYDKDGKAVKMKSASGTEYVKVANFTKDITVAPGEVWDKEIGLPIEDNADIVYIKVIAAAYEDESGIFWENPTYSDWKFFLEDVTLKDYQLSEEEDRAEQR